VDGSAGTPSRAAINAFAHREPPGENPSPDRYLNHARVNLICYICPISIAEVTDYWSGDSHMSRPFEPDTQTAAPWRTGADQPRPSYGSSRYGDSSGYTGGADDSAGYRSSYDSYGTDSYRTNSYGTDSYGTARHGAGSYAATTVADRPTDEDHYADEAHTDVDDAYPDYPDDGYYAYDEPIDRRWIWVAGVAAAILLVAVICTVVILGGGDSGPVTATVAPPAPTTSVVAAPNSTPSAAAAPRVAPPVAPPTASLAPETVTTITPSATPTAVATPTPTAAATPTDVAPPAAAPVPAAADQTITYRITGTHPLLDLVTVIYTDGQGALQTDVNVALPWAKTITLDPGVSLASVTATTVTGALNCSITDGTGAAIAVQNNNAMIASCTR
jgi:hypothetical protein